MCETLSIAVRSELPEGFLKQLCDLIARRIGDLAPIVFDHVLENLMSRASLEPAGGTKDTILVRWGAPQDLDREVVSAFRALGRDIHEGRIFGHGSSSVLADGDSGDSVAADPRNNGTPDTSEKGVNGDA